MKAVAKAAALRCKRRYPGAQRNDQCAWLAPAFGGPLARARGAGPGALERLGCTRSFANMADVRQTLGAWVVEPNWAPTGGLHRRLCLGQTGSGLV